MNCLPEVACEPVWVDDLIHTIQWRSAVKNVAKGCRISHISVLSSIISEEHRQKNLYIHMKRESHFYGVGTIKYAVNDLLLSIMQHDGWLF